MNDQKQVAFDPKVYEAWRNLAAAILDPQFNLDAPCLPVQNQPTDI
jgi:hypothetical protein